MSSSSKLRLKNLSLSLDAEIIASFLLWSIWACEEALMGNNSLHFFKTCKKGLSIVETLFKSSLSKLFLETKLLIVHIKIYEI